jgi:hypothetical protein
MVTVHARFRLDTDSRLTHYQKNRETGNYEAVEAAQVKLGAVQGEPFGSASPSGSMEMVIVNPEAIRLFREAELGQEYDLYISAVKVHEQSEH